jgi:putative ABC transport system substrate-binding protein
MSLVVVACTSSGDDPAAEGPAATSTVVEGSEAGEGAQGSQPVEVPTATVGLVVLAPVPTHELTASGFKDSAADCDMVDIEVIERNAQGDIPALTQLTDGLLTLRVDMIATVTTAAAQAAHELVGERGGDTPVVYATVTDPFSAGLAQDAATHDPWITGSASPPPVAAVVDAAQDIVPDLSVLGVVRNPAEANSRFAVQSLERVARERGLTVEIIDVEESSQVGEAALALVEQSIDAFVVPTDTTVYAGLPALAGVANDNDILVIGTDPNQTASGAAIALGSDYYGSGFRAGGIACRVLGGEATPADFDVIDIESLGITINERAAEAQQVVIPAHLREEAETVE